MNSKYYVVVIFIFGLLIFSNTASPTAMAQQSSGQSGSLTVTIDFLATQLSLETFEAAIGSMSSCAGDMNCEKHAKLIKSWGCVADVCNGLEKSKEPVACFDDSSKDFSIQVQDQIDSTICATIKSPSPATRRAVLSNIPNNTEDHLVENIAYSMALKSSVNSCEDYIKSYVGPYGPKWSYKWYRAMSGCRILGRESTMQQEQQDFRTWFGVVRGMGNCSNINNNEMRSECSAPNSASPIPVYDQ